MSEGTGHGDAGAGAGPDAAQDPGLDEVIVVSPSPLRAAAWTLVGAFAIGAAGWTLSTTSSSLLLFVAAPLLLLSVPATLVFALQVFAPGAWTLRLGLGRLRGHALGMPVDIDLADVRSIHVRRLLGDRTLVVETVHRRRRLLLPLGADIQGLERAAARLAARPTPRAHRDVWPTRDG